MLVDSVIAWEREGIMESAPSKWIPLCRLCRGVGIVLFALAFRSRFSFTMVVLAAKADLEEQRSPLKTANAQSIINMLIRRCISFIVIGKVVVAVEAVEVVIIALVLY